MTACRGNRQPAPAPVSPAATETLTGSPASPGGPPVIQPSPEVAAGTATDAPQPERPTVTLPTLLPSPFPGAPLIVPAGEWIPLDAQDPFFLKMQAEGYTLFQAGSFETGSGVVHAAYTFTRFDLNQPVGEHTFILAFYRFEDEQPRLLATFSPPVYSQDLPVFPSYYRLVDWDHLQISLMGLKALETPDENTRTRLSVRSHASDYNRNGRPEFVFGAEYCPVACLDTLQAYDIYEIAENGEVIDLTRSLPGRLRMLPVRLEPLTFEAVQTLSFGERGKITLPTFFTWEDNRDEDVTAQNADLIGERMKAIRERLAAVQGRPLVQDELLAEVYGLLLFSERIGEREQGLNEFLKLTDPRNWGQVNERIICWLQIARAQAQDEFAGDRAFTLPVPLSAFNPNTDLPRLLEPFAAGNYDLSACGRWQR